MELADAVEELYGVLPEEFVATRTELQRRARADGDRALATEIGGLAKPSTAAWLANALVRHSADDITGLLELGDLLRDAQASLAGDELRRLDVQRRRLIGALGRQARALAAELGHPVSAAVATQVEETLRAAMTDPEAAEALRSGRLTGALSYSGLGTAPRPELRVVPPPRAGRRAAEPEPEPAPARPRGARDRAAEERREREEATRRAEAERRRRELAEAREDAERATAAAEEAAAAEEEARADVAGLRERESAVAARVDELTHELSRLRQERDGIGADLSEARRRRSAAARRSAESAARRERAQVRVAALESDD